MEIVGLGIGLRTHAQATCLHRSKGGGRRRGLGGGEAVSGVLVGFGHGGLERLEKKGEALIAGDGAARSKLEGGKAAKDRAEPSDGGVRAKAGEVGPDEGEVSEGAEGGAGLVMGRFGDVSEAVDPGSGGGGVREVGW